ncbi:hypothetical protein [Nocardia otitidiscaviarum]|nr:hypothetical protein [Nocardia otitidiscaviarum]
MTMRARIGRVIMAVPIAMVVMASSACSNADESEASADAQPSISTTEQTPTRTSVLDQDVLEDECILTAAEVKTLVDVDVKEGENNAFTKHDGSEYRSCEYYFALKDLMSPLAQINVRRAMQGMPLDVVLELQDVPGDHPIPGIAREVLVKDNRSGVTIYTDAYIVSISIFTGMTDLIDKNTPLSITLPTDDEWATISRKVVARLPEQ